MIALLVVLAVLWLAYVIIDSMGPVGIFLVALGALVAFLSMGA